MESKRKRGANYTPQEVEKLLELVERHHIAIEEKRTGSAFLKQKKEAWEAVCSAYNAVATSGPRTVEQLRVFYDNKKQKARKVLIEHNKSECLSDQEHATNEHTQIKPSLVPIQYRKVGICRCPTVTDQELKIFDLVRNQVTPPPSCDSRGCFGDQTHEAEELVVEVKPLENGETDVKTNPSNQSKVGAPTKILHEKEKGHVGSFTCLNLPALRKVTSAEKKRRKKLSMVTPLKGNYKPDFKQLYFKRKCYNAYLEKRKLCQDMRLRQLEHDMLVKEHMTRLQFMQEEHVRKMKMLE